VYYGQPLPYSIAGQFYGQPNVPDNWQIEFKCSPYCGQMSFGFAIAIFYPNPILVGGSFYNWRADSLLGGFQHQPPWDEQECDPLRASGNYGLLAGLTGQPASSVTRCGEMSWQFLVTE
jgi:hypothetical protein